MAAGEHKSWQGQAIRKTIRVTEFKIFTIEDLNAFPGGATYKKTRKHITF